MKKLNNLPDFSKLCQPEQKAVMDVVSLYIFFFFSGSVCGYLWEVLIFFVKEGTFRNRGFLYGPWLPVYGIGAVIFYLLLSEQPFDPFPARSVFFQKRRYFRHGQTIGKKNHPVTVFFLSALLGSGLELVIGWFLDTFWQLRYWDYSGYFLNLHGFICLASALGFGFAGVLWVCFFSKLFRNIWFQFSFEFRKKWNTFWIFIFLTDCAAALIFPNIGKGITF